MQPSGMRRKGHSFERRIAREYRTVFNPPERVRRGRQTHRADEPDVVVDYAPLWTECGHGAVMNPLTKLKQAEKEARVAGKYNSNWSIVAVTRRNRAAIRVTMRLETLMRLQAAGWSCQAPGHDGMLRVLEMPVHIEWSDYLELLRSQPWARHPRMK